MEPQAVSVIGFIYGFIPAAISIYRERTDERCTRGLFLKKTIKFSIWFVIIIYGIAELAKLTVQNCPPIQRDDERNLD